MTDDEILSRITDVMRDTLKGAQAIATATRATTARDVAGWDSLSHAVLVLSIEEEFGVELPLERTLELDNVGDLVDLIRQVREG